MLDSLDQMQIRQTAIQLGIPDDFVRKDYFVTKALHTLTAIENDYFALIFQGGTSLSKGYQIIRRLSEDVDFRIIQKTPALKLGKEARRKQLRDFRYDLIQALKNTAFQISDQDIKVFYEGRFMNIHAKYEGSDRLTYLKPYVAIDCFLGEFTLEPQQVEITTLIKQTLGDACAHLSFPVICLALDETVAEKWVALTRRITGIEEKPRPSDPHLVRHLYDLYHLTTSDLLTGDYCKIAGNIMEKDRSLFKKQNTLYTNNPKQASEMALDLLFKNPRWRDHWHYFLEQMVYEENKPSFDKAYGRLQILSQEIFGESANSSTE